MTQALVKTSPAEDPRKIIAQEARSRRDDVVGATLRLLSYPTEQPPGDTRAIAAAIMDELRAMPGVEVRLHASANHIHNLTAVVRGAGAGRRLLFSGHLDTFPIGNRDAWTVDPAGALVGDRLYGLGVSDMKGGLAASLFAFRLLAENASAWNGEAVIALAGDEETMGEFGTQHLLDTAPEMRADAVIVGDVGSPTVLRIGEKGLMWIKLTAKGRSAHAAHVHRGDSAIDKLLQALSRIADLRNLPVPTSPELRAIVEKAAPVSEPLSGEGESDVMLSVTVTFGTISGGRLPNLVSDHAEATADIRLPLGVSIAEARAAITRGLADVPGVGFEVLRAYEPSFTPPENDLVASLAAATGEILNVTPVVNMRVGASDARLFRRAGIPTVVCGLTPNNMGAADEYVDVEELKSLGEIFTVAAFDYLAGA